MVNTLAGTRIREARRRAGLSQTALAARAGISASYMNLIEHNRRGAAGKVLVAIAQALGSTPSAFSRDADLELRSDVAEASVLGDVDLSTTEDLIGRFPEWAALIAQLHRHIKRQDQAISALSDRLTHDPYLQESVHGMLSTITAIRSTASILAQVKSVPEIQQDRFHRSVHEESIRLSDVAEGLATYLTQASTLPDRAVTPEEALDQLLNRNRWHFDAIDQEVEKLSDVPPEAAQDRLAQVVEEIASSEPGLEDNTTRIRFTGWLQQYAHDALAMPFDHLVEVARDSGFDPIVISHVFGADLHAVFRRLATLKRSRIEAPTFGLITVNAAGYPVFRKTLPEFALPRHGNACPLLPLFAAFSQPTVVQQHRLALDNGRQFHSLSVALPRNPRRLSEPPEVLASMLIVAETDNPFPPLADAPRAVGSSCRICAQPDCRARAEPRIITQGSR